MSAPDRELWPAIAVTRFGLGAKPGELAEAARDPRGWLKAQIRPEGADVFPTLNGGTGMQRVADLLAFEQEQRKLKLAVAAGQDPKSLPPNSMRRMLKEALAQDFLTRARLGAATDAGFRERWALFFANHFTVAANKIQTTALVAPFEVEAIRPHVFGRFADLLVAAETHPAMMFYLDQAQSVGPNSPLARRAASPPPGRQVRSLGLNENLAREIMELHTVGVDGGYAQADVTEFARAMTGLSIGGVRGAEPPGASVFRIAAHEPGDRTVMGVRYDAGGREQAAKILADLAAKPQTARFVCSKLARHFVADAPPPALVARLEAAWKRSDGDLGEVAQALIAAPEAWAPAQAKFKTPYEFVISSHRAAGAEPQAQVGPVLTSLGQAPFAPGSPKGWPEDAAAWASPDGIVKRMQFAQGFAALAVQDRDPKTLAAEALGARLTPATATAVARAESRPEGFALLLMSPEFQRR